MRAILRHLDIRCKCSKAREIILCFAKKFTECDKVKPSQFTSKCPILDNDAKEKSECDVLRHVVF